MVAIGNFFFKYRNLLFPVIAIIVFMPAPRLFSEGVFGRHYELILLIAGVVLALSGQVVRGATIGLRYIIRGGRNKQVYADDLVIDGIFAHCRNPLYVGNIIMVAGVALLSNSVYFILIGVPIFCFLYQCIVLAEEHFLRGKFGERFEAYCSSVNRWVPKLKGLGSTFQSMTFNWRRYVLKEYNTIYLLMVSMYLVILTHYSWMIALSRNEKVVVSTVVIGIISAVYLVVRTLKKTRRLTEESTAG